MVIAHTKNNLVVGKESLVKLINIILFHIYQSQIQSVVLYQIAGTDRTIFLQNNSDFRILVMKCDEKLREKDSAQHRRDPNTKRGFYSRHTGVIRLKLGAVLKNVGSFVIKRFAFFGKNQSVSLSIEKADAEFNFQVADSNGHSGLSNV